MQCKTPDIEKDRGFLLRKMDPNAFELHQGACRALLFIDHRYFRAVSLLWLLLGSLRFFL